MKKRVTGIGGVFLKAKDPDATRDWYRNHLGIESGKYGGTFEWRHAEDPDKRGYTAWSMFDENTEYTNPSKKDAMVNYRVENLEELLMVLEEEGVEIVGEMEVYEYGKFGWIMDPNGYKIELWEPNDEEYEKIKGETNLSS
ncbi:MULTISPECIES: VOC family protein [Gracilimonas]|uniref:VOC family protein n=1 Tax=Gracilimonas sediminicola TaxID=2952158 RepID=A0A9X2RF68_9BACT|nr:VOC family protein [Gracilimonas sediminicola]MCP9290653.1 VOC family protein [Gracilimonas sediminicola]